jgi:hypothetical protein
MALETRRRDLPPPVRGVPAGDPPRPYRVHGDLRDHPHRETIGTVPRTSQERRQRQPASGHAARPTTEPTALEWVLGAVVLGEPTVGLRADLVRLSSLQGRPAPPEGVIESNRKPVTFVGRGRAYRRLGAHFGSADTHRLSAQIDRYVRDRI